MNLREGDLTIDKAIMKCSLTIIAMAGTSLGLGFAQNGTNVYLTEVPDYAWHAGCFGTATGNLMGYWDRHGFDNFYTGPTGGGLAPLNSNGSNANIFGMWASEAGVDGRPQNQPGHMDDYYIGYESTGPDPYVTSGRAEHEPDCIGDFIGLNQRKWKDLNGECEGNIDGYSFVFWEPTGEKRINYQPMDPNGGPISDIPSGLVAWTRYRGSEAEVGSQLTEFYPDTAPGKGFTFEDMKREIDSGYPVLLFMQAFNSKSRTLHGVDNVNPIIHGMLAYGYFVDDSGQQFVRYRTSWASGDFQLSLWGDGNWTPLGALNLPLRGVMTYRPLPRITQIEAIGLNQLKVTWQGPSSELLNTRTGQTAKLHRYVLERSDRLDPDSFQAISEPMTEKELVVPVDSEGSAFFRVRLIEGAPKG